MKSFTLLLLLLGSSFLCTAQVSEIKSASSAHHSSGSASTGDGGGGFDFLGNFMINIMFNGIVQAQTQMLARKHDVPTMVSLEMITQAAVQPASYYILNPRIRGNWALFSTDFRMNYLLEEGIDGY